MDRNEDPTSLIPNPVRPSWTKFCWVPVDEARGSNSVSQVLLARVLGPPVPDSPPTNWPANSFPFSFAAKRVEEMFGPDVSNGGDTPSVLSLARSMSATERQRREEADATAAAEEIHHEQLAAELAATQTEIAGAGGVEGGKQR